MASPLHPNLPPISIISATLLYPLLWLEIKVYATQRAKREHLISCNLKRGGERPPLGQVSSPGPLTSLMFHERLMIALCSSQSHQRAVEYGSVRVVRRPSAPSAVPIAACTDEEPPQLRKHVSCGSPNVAAHRLNGAPAQPT
jgi:hypothetical protein